MICEGPIDTESGMVVDFADLRKWVEQQVIDVVDHQVLNDFLENPTAENIVAWMWERLQGGDVPLLELRLHETSSCWVAYRRPDA